MDKREFQEIEALQNEQLKVAYEAYQGKTINELVGKLPDSIYEMPLRLDEPMASLVKDIAFDCIAKYHRQVSRDFRAWDSSQFNIKPGEKYLFVVSQKDGYDISDICEDAREYLTACLLELGLSRNDFRIMMVGGMDIKPYAIIED